jgi:hypothetical protein
VVRAHNGKFALRQNNGGLARFTHFSNHLKDLLAAKWSVSVWQCSRQYNPKAQAVELKEATLDVFT